MLLGSLSEDVCTGAFRIKRELCQVSQGSDVASGTAAHALELETFLF